jgi:hypothetical protein
MNSQRISQLKQLLIQTRLNHKKEIMKEPTLKDATIYCAINNLSAQQFGPLLEKYMNTHFNYTKNSASACTGDSCKDGKNAEVKVSLGGSTHTKFNYVQLRPSHNCDLYILTAFYLCDENADEGGKLFIFRIPKEDMKNIIVAHGGYAHGAIKQHGRITYESVSIKDNKEYAIRPEYDDKCWRALLPFQITEADL